MDSSTIIFIATIAIAFIVLRWLISPIPQSNEFGIPTETTTGTASSTAVNTTQTRRRDRRLVSDSMVEVVSTIAPELTREQIIYDLQKTGSVELTINNYIENGGLPYPPNTSRTSTTARTTNANTQNGSNAGRSTSGSETSTPKPPQVDFKSVNLLEKFNIDVNNPVCSDNDLVARKQQMILNARNRLQKQLADAK